ncbi:MAG: tetratricopeptide repeat protein, partial [Candidatus Omnitrophota bacterium]
IAQRGYYDFKIYARKSEFLGVTQRAFPSGAVDFIQANGITGPVFNDFNSGAYLVGRLYPQIKVFIDGRTEVYGSKFFLVYRQIWEDGNRQVFDALTLRYGLRAIVLGSAFGHIPERLLQMLDKNPAWKLVYFDHDGLVFLRNIPANAALIKKFHIDLKQWKPLPFDIPRMGVVRAYPYREANRAATLNDMGYPDQAMAEADAALAISPECDEALYIKARVYLDRKDFSKAFKFYRYGLLRSFDDVKLRRGLALSYIGMGKYAQAVEQADRLEGVAGDPSGPYIRAKVFVKKKQYHEAYDILTKRIFPLERGIPEIVAIGDIYMEDGVYDLAVQAYALALRKNTRKDVRNIRILKKYRDAVIKRQEGKGKSK